ncbi:hypothetical protein [Neolewinella antarctica]|uniref:Uncharacterized protein n=1 Tax=Neolewinella antarctica TaxID=442734 RepID=A0ABX0XGN3_9BACT|nr:hypothetical protein [Neolewinella antarctica]NJC28069.1 hypothetical protein [Neolewinella antarctica]
MIGRLYISKIIKNKPVTYFLANHKYEILLAALIAHLYVGIFLTDLTFYIRFVWPVNMPCSAWPARRCS